MKRFFTVLNKIEIRLRKDPEEIRDNTRNLTGELKDKYFREHNNRMVNYSFTPLYRMIEFSQGGILAMRAPIRMMRILEQARMGNRKTLYFWFNGSGYRINPEMVCSICNKLENEDLFHILNVMCPMYNALREIGLGDSLENSETFWDILKPFELEGVKEFMQFYWRCSASPFIYYK